MFGLPAVLVPYQFAWRYQKVNADYLVKHGAAVLLEHDRLPAELLPTLQNLSRDRERLTKMRQAMKSLAQPEAARAIASLVREIAGTREPASNPGNMERKHG
jgi:UDP-N-acetylglucosamine--N-acetylmuramyl-(pentapeptide) pyrophosphoryl-undecaprenol N-acetylglucosamine transferase